MRIIFGVLLALAWLGGAYAHDEWANGDPIPEWVKSQCCGPSDAHRLDPGQAHRVAGGWAVDGVPLVWTDEKVFASQDGYTWAFYSGQYTYCLFVPLAY